MKFSSSFALAALPYLAMAAPAAKRQYSPEQGAGFAAPSGGMSGSAAQSGGFAAPSGGFAAPSGGFAAPSGGFAAPSGGFAAPSGGFAAPSGGFSGSSGSAAPSGSSGQSGQGYAPFAKRQYSPEQGAGFAAPSGGMSGSATQSGGYAAPSGGFAAPSGGFGGFSGSAAPSGGSGQSGQGYAPFAKRQYSPEQGAGFAAPSGGVRGSATQSGGYAAPSGGFAAPSGGFGGFGGSAAPSGFSGGQGYAAPSGSSAVSSSYPTLDAKVAVASGIFGDATGTGSAVSATSTGSSTNSSSSATTTDGPIGYASTNGGTTGGEGGTTTTVSSLAEFTAAATADEAMVIYISGTISGSDQVKVTSDTSILGLNSESALEGIGLYVKDVSNVILRNFASSKVLAENGDAIGIQASTNVWCDHLDLSSDLEHGKDYYDGLLDVTHASEWVTISNVYFHDHYKASLVGHSDSNGDEDTGHLHVTYANNYWSNISSRCPSIRFGTGHIFNSYFEGLLSSGIDTRDGAQVLVESNVFSDSEKPLASLYSDDEGYAVASDNDFGSGENAAPEGTLTSVPYEYTLLGSSAVKAAVVGTAGNTLTLG